MTSWSFNLAAAAAGVVVAACGSDVVSDPRGGESEGSAGPGGAPGASSSSGDGADGGRGGAFTSSTGFASSSSGMPGPCTGMTCGVPCTVCNDMECLMGYCDQSDSCQPLVTTCFPQDPSGLCPTADQAPNFVCSGCGGGKGCTFFGCVLGGPYVGDAQCCYDIVGDCVPNP